MGDTGVRARDAEFSPRRQAFDDAAMGVADWLVRGVSRHWLLVVNALVFVFAFLPFLSPLLQSMDNATARWLGDGIFAAYSYTCHQLPERSWTIFGHQMAYCERDAAIYPAMFISGLAFARARAVSGRTRRLGWLGYFIFILPMAIDGTGQLFGLWESTWLSRTVTGSLFGTASVWLAYPYLQSAVAELES